MTTFFTSNTIGSALKSHRGDGPGFAIMRLGLAAVILLNHARSLSAVFDPGERDASVATDLHVMAGWSASHRPFYVLLVPAFFALSGFLVTGSALRLRVTSTFLAFRALRIFPALTVEVTLSALLLGPIFTRLPWREYFTDFQFFRYFGNIIGWVTFYLPGVFEVTNRVPVVNGNLWTLPPEFDCYFITAALMGTALIYRRTFVTIVLAIVTIVLAALNGFTDFAETPFQYTTYAITYYFFVGMVMFQWKDYLPARWWLFVLSAIIGYAFAYCRHTVFLAPVFVTYCIAYLGVVGLPEIRWLRGRDYSYGIYLYGMPITQGILAALPTLRGHSYSVMIAAVATTTLFATFSWNFIEKPALALKNRLPKRFFPGLASSRIPTPTVAE
jgi:peptidoglycan/LPS O-acetylase OafA/YrhL